MSGDVLLTGEGRDLLPTDRIVDTEQGADGINLSAQQMDTVVHIAEGEWLIDIREGIDWIGYLTDRRVNVQALVQEVKREFETVPGVTISSAAGEHINREILLAFEGFVRQTPFRLTVLGQQNTSETLGDDRALAPLFLRWAFNTVV